jgi:hypothetical protein
VGGFGLSVVVVVVATVGGGAGGGVGFGGSGRHALVTPSARSALSTIRRRVIGTSVAGFGWSRFDGR